MQHLYKLFFFCLLMPNIGLGQQNLVPNFSFEDTLSCPFGDSDMNAANHWYAGKNTPDLFHPCANTASPIVGVPDNFPGNQAPFDGMAYAGFYTYGTISFYREIMGVMLQQPLQIGTEYFVSAYMSRGNANSSGGNFDCATNKAGFRFSTVKYEAAASNPVPIDNFAHIYSNDFLTDTNNWVLVSGSFIADSAYTYLLIGNFFDDINTGVTSCQGVAYYYIDNVCVSTHAGTCDITVRASEPLKQGEISLYPNPASQRITINNIKGANHYKIFNNTGFQTLKGLLKESDNTIDVSILPDGIYFLQLNHKRSFKFIISH